MQAYLLVFLGGGLGSICRFGIAEALRSHHYHFPFATFAANILSCIILGVLLGLSFRGDLNPSTRFLLMTGFCGGFSTFSTFSGETYQLLLSGNTGYALANVAGNLLVCLFCLFLGIKMVTLVNA